MSASARCRVNELLKRLKKDYSSRGISKRSPDPLLSQLMSARVSLLQSLLALLLECFDVQATKHHLSLGVLDDERTVLDPFGDILAFHSKELCHLARLHQSFG